MLAVVSCIIALFGGVKVITVFVNLVISFIWTVILSWICKKDFVGMSWLLVLFPYLMMLLIFFGIDKVSANTKKNLLMVMPPAAITQFK